MKDYQKLLLFWVWPTFACLSRADAETGLKQDSAWDISHEVSIALSNSVALESDAGPSRDMDTREVALEVELKRAFAGKLPRVFGVALEFSRDSWKSESAVGYLPEKLTSVAVEASYLAVHSERWSSFIAISPGLNSAGSSGLESDGFGVEVVALARYAASDALQFWIGAHGDSLAEGSDRFNPVIGLDWSFKSDWKLSLGVPQTALVYSFSEAISFGLGVDLRSDVYALTDKYEGLNGLPDDSKLEFLDVRVGLLAEWHIQPALRLSAKLGTVVLRELEIQADDLRQKWESDGIGGLFARISCTYEF